MRNSFLISVVAASLLLSGCDSTDTTTNDIVESTTKSVSGRVIDGYVAGATVKIGDYTVTTDANGYYEIPNVAYSDNMTIEAFGGIDISTGEAFEGILKAAYNPDEANTIITPLSTLVASAVENGSTVEEATITIAKQLGITEETLKADPIELLKTGTVEEKEDAAKAIMNALAVQKMAESISASAGTITEDKNEIFDSVMDAVAIQLQENSIDAVLLDTVVITNKASELLAEKEKFQVENFIEKLSASAEAASEVVKSIQSIDESELSSAEDVDDILNKKAKAIEVATSAIEKSLSKIAEALDLSDIESSKFDVSKITQMITMLGGIDGVSQSITDQEKLQTDKEVDAGDFSENLFSSETVEAQSAKFKELKAYNLEDDMIEAIAEGILSTKEGEAPNIDAIIQTILENRPEAEVDSNDIAQIAIKMQESMDDQKESMEKAFNLLEDKEIPEIDTSDSEESTETTESEDSTETTESEDSTETTESEDSTETTESEDPTETTDTTTTTSSSSF